jgi:uncharacterized protein
MPEHLDSLRQMDRQIVTFGIGTVDLAPDLAHVDIRVFAVRAGVEEATGAMTEAVEGVTAALREAGAVEVATSRFHIREEFDRQGAPAGYRAETAVRATAALPNGSGDPVSAILGAAVQSGGDALGVDGIIFASSEEERALLEALELAVTDAHAKATALAHAAGVSVGEVVSIEQLHREGSPGPLMFARSDASGPPMSPGTQEATVEIKATFEIAPLGAGATPAY